MPMAITMLSTLIIVPPTLVIMRMAETREGAQTPIQDPMATRLL